MTNNTSTVTATGDGASHNTHPNSTLCLSSTPHMRTHTAIPHQPGRCPLRPMPMRFDASTISLNSLGWWK